MQPTIYLPTHFSIHLFIKKLSLSVIGQSSLKVSLRTLLLFCHLIKSSNILGLYRDSSRKHKGLSKIVSAMQLINTGLFETIIFLER